MNLDLLKSDIANNEIRVLVNGQPETVDFKQWCKQVADVIDSPHGLVKDIIIQCCEGWTPRTKTGHFIYNQLDY